MPPTDSDHQRGANGHADPADAETLKLGPIDFPPPRRSLLSKGWRVMTGRPRASARDEEAPLTRVPGWLTGLACSALLLGLAQTGALIYRISHYDTVEALVKERMNDIYQDLRAQDQYNQLVTIYENRIQQLLIEAGVDSKDLPPVPVRPTLGKPHPKPKGD